VETLATRDSLTGLMNRQTMEALLKEEGEKHASDNHSLTVALVDLDHFKRINDTHGHHIGDEVLSAFAGAVPKALRKTDTVARWGGEEFLILFPKARPPQIIDAMERLRSRLAETRVLENTVDLIPTFSAGIAELPPGADIERTLERADKALYEAKHSGRNRWVVVKGNSDPH
jgi:diguanylate cyclase (GGDEF)-like protein